MRSSTAVYHAHLETEKRLNKLVKVFELSYSGFYGPSPMSRCRVLFFQFMVK